ncbi:hypothetical protein [Chryseobacterium sp. Leaf201]|uniref:hypothetical protein n=1 Tax=Chryseobacterium sp. Leaf201 TaxID=1735672 RepID=UPI0012FE9889|nr:hypothetical protein [Chryseobacterium sp. Leaf201]
MDFEIISAVAVFLYKFILTNGFTESSRSANFLRKLIPEHPIKTAPEFRGGFV